MECGGVRPGPLSVCVACVFCVFVCTCICVFV